MILLSADVKRKVKQLCSDFPLMRTNNGACSMLAVAIKGGGGLRPSWDRTFRDSRCGCRAFYLFARKVGAVLVKDKRILTTGYNGAPAV